MTKYQKTIGLLAPTIKYAVLLPLAWLFANWCAPGSYIPPSVSALSVALVVLAASGGVAVMIRRFILRTIAGDHNVELLITAFTVMLALTLWFLTMAATGRSTRPTHVVETFAIVFIFVGLYRELRSVISYRRHTLSRKRREDILVLGAGEATVLLLKNIGIDGRWHVRGLIDDDPKKIGTLVGGVEVLGAFDELPNISRRLKVNTVVVAIPSANTEQRLRISGIASSAGLNIFSIPTIGDIVSGRVSIADVRKINLENLLGRDPVRLDQEKMGGLFGGRCVMVTGAAGSIGSEICRQILKFSPDQLVCFDLSEFGLYRLEEEFSGRGEVNRCRYIVGDVKDVALLRRAISEFKPSVVFHAAAYKHVPILERFNAWQAVRNNSLGSYNLGRVCIELGVPKVVLVSTDKAVNPTNVMGASKRLAERIFQGLNAKCVEGSLRPQLSPTAFICVRFGNVLGSSGSVVPKFEEQIARGGPITITHKDIVRYFMLIPEAAQLVLQAACMGNGGEMFLLDMGAPVRIVDLAKNMIHLSGFTEEQIPIVFTGLRPGEKLYEELLADKEATLPTEHPKLRLQAARDIPLGDWLANLDAEIEVVYRDEQSTKQMLHRFIPEYQSQRFDGEASAVQ
jgi:FlaA1/EpsC-like NDP-sugar epimerase